LLSVSLALRRGDFALDVAFAAPTPGVIALFGRSGSGKTTAVHGIAGLLRAEVCRVELDGESLGEQPAEKRRIGCVFQDARLFPHRSVLGNLRYGAKRAPAAARGVGLDEAVELLGLRELLARRPRQLSGGEKQRVAIGRALLSKPRLLMLDEPLASIDLGRRAELLPYLERLRDELRIPLVYVSHQFDEVIRLATHVVLLEAGRVAAQGGVTELCAEPALRAIVGADQLGAVLEAPVESIEPRRGEAGVRVGSGLLVVSASHLALGERVRVQVLARDVLLALEAPKQVAVRSALQGVIAALGPDASGARFVEVDVGGARLYASVATPLCSELGLTPGRRVFALVNAASLCGRALGRASTAGAAGH
jgi:molybdate transport system ATP-binding protein